MRRIGILVLVGMLVGLAAPIDAAESVSSSYDGALGWRLPLPPTGTAADVVAYLGFVVCESGCDLNERCVDVPDAGPLCPPNTGLLPVVSPVGGAALHASKTYRNVIVAATDDLYGSDAGTSSCFWNPDGDSVCNPHDDYPSAPGCGPSALIGSPFTSDFLTVWIFSLIVEDDFTICGGTAGVMTGDFF